MSAENWAICPRCETTRQARLAAEQQEVANSYGKVPVAEFDDARARLAERLAEQAQHTLREDYELGILENGEFYVIYKGHCRECGLSHEFRHEERVT